MKELCVLLALVGASLAASTYTSKYDSINLDEILNNERLYRKYVDCLKGLGRCTPDGRELKEHLPEALENGCSRCTAKQRAGSEKVLKFLIKNRKEDFGELEKIYYPNGIYRKKYREDASRAGLQLE
uniref:Protein serine/threonine kinase, putative n=1 Tax=Riptortus pedestris TaxID=329032 RepID=R4WD24_RIPPE|nr:protein serine/threonine kinase, putative [Riptortus pedestris]